MVYLPGQPHPKNKKYVQLWSVAFAIQYLWVSTKLLASMCSSNITKPIIALKVYHLLHSLTVKHQKSHTVQ